MTRAWLGGNLLAAAAAHVTYSRDAVSACFGHLQSCTHSGSSSCPPARTNQSDVLSPHSATPPPPLKVFAFMGHGPGRKGEGGAKGMRVKEQQQVME